MQAKAPKASLKTFSMCLCCVQGWIKPKKKGGRPITHNDDPNASDQTEIGQF